jgi:hypothetical protein
VPTLPLQSPAQPNLGSDTNCQDQPSALLPINRTIGSFADQPYRRLFCRSPVR